MLDLTASEEALGKPVASDIREGKATLVIIHALENGTAMEREAIQTVLTDGHFDRVTHEEILSILRRYRSVEFALRTASRHAAAARTGLDGATGVGVQTGVAVCCRFSWSHAISNRKSVLHGASATRPLLGSAGAACSNSRPFAWLR